MKFKLSVLPIALLTVGCAPERLSTGKVGSIDPAFNSYIAIFESMYGAKVTDIDFSFKDLSRPVIGQCSILTTTYGKTKRIQVDPTYWNDEHTSEHQKVGLIFHEIGHCFLNRPHTEDKMYYAPEGLSFMVKIPSSIMYPYNFYSSFYEPLKAYYYTELINPETRKSE